MKKQILNELYIGKTPIIPLQNQFSIIRNKIKGKSFSNSINTDKDLLKFNRMVEKLFGFSSYALNFTPDNYLDGSTWSFKVYESKNDIIKINSQLQANKYGFRHDPNSNVTTITSISLGIINYNFTDEEIMAIILHEIGHQFFLAVSDKNCTYFINLINSVKMLNNIIIERISSGNIIDIKDIKNDVDIIANKFNINNLFNNIKFKTISIPKSLKSISKFFSKKFFKESMYDNMKKTRIKYTDEKFADSFAVMYGYGEEFHSGMLKFEKWILDNDDIKPQSRNSAIIAFKTFINMTKDMFTYIKDNYEDEHPNDLARIKVSIDYLKRELAKESLDPKVKLEIMKQIENMQKLIDDYINFPKDEDSIAIRRAYYRELYKRFGGDRREQDTDNKALFDTIDKRFDEILNSK